MGIRNSIFLKNVLTLMAGTATAQVISIAATPIITRLYTPAEFGVLDLFISIIGILTPVTSLRYDQAIVIAKDHDEGFLLTKLTIIINGILCTALLLVVLLFSKQFSIWLGNEAIRYFLLLIPLIIFFSSFFNASKYFAIRTQDFKIISKASVYKSFISSTVQVVLGILKPGAIGLISGPLSSAVFINKTVYNKATKGNKNKSFKFWKYKERVQYIYLMRRYKDFPKYSVASALANTVVLSGTSIFIFKAYSAIELGYLALAQRLLSIPLTLIAGSVGDVFFQKVSHEKNEKGNAEVSFTNTFKFLALIAIGGVIVCYFFAPPLFAFVFGSKWAMAGYYTSVLVFLYGIRFVNSPLSNTFVAFEKQKELLVWTLVQLVVLCITILITIRWKLDFHNYILLYVVTQSLFYLVFLFRSWQIALNK